MTETKLEVYGYVTTLVGLLEDMAKNPKNNEEYTKTLTDAAIALRAVLRFW